MRFDDINAAMERARYEIIEDDEPYYAEIPEVKGVWATGKNLEECRRNLAAALKLWHLFQRPNSSSYPSIRRGLEAHMTWKDILLNALTTPMFLSVLAFVAKSAVEKWLARNLEKYKVELQSTAFEHQTRFTKLHEQRAAVITELYQRMDRIRQLWEASVRPLRLNVDPEPEQQQNEASRRSLELQEFYFQNKLFLEEELCTAMEDLLPR